jgi:hypothetical protein
MKRKAIIPIITLAVAFSFLALSSVAVAGDVTVSYPSKDVTGKVGEPVSFPFTITNGSDEKITAVLSPEGFDNVSVSGLDNVEILGGNKEKITLSISSDSECSFSGDVHFAVKTDSSSSGTGGKLVTGGAVPIDGKFVTDLYFKVKLFVHPEDVGKVGIEPDKDRYAEGEEVTVWARPTDQDWKFDQWTGGISSKDNSVTITVDEDMSLTANFDEVPSTGTGIGWIPPSFFQPGDGGGSAEILLGSYNAGQFSEAPDSTYTIGDTLAFAVRSDSPITVEVRTPGGLIEVTDFDQEDNVYYGGIDTSAFDTQGSYVLKVKSGGEVLESKSFTLQAPNEGGGMPWGYILGGLLVILTPLVLILLDFKTPFVILFTGAVGLVVVAWFVFL